MTPFALAAPAKLVAVVLAALSDALPVAEEDFPPDDEEPVAEAVEAAVLAWLWVAATLATEAMDEEAAARRGSAALQYEVTVFSTGGRSLLLGQLL